MTDTLIINMFGAPGAGKSTTATGVFSLLKLAGINAEYVPEVAKDMTWEERKKSLTFQPYIFAKQMRNIERVMGKVDVIVTDSAPLLSSFYGRYYKLPYPESFHKFVTDCHTDYLKPALNYLLLRTKPYNPEGRNQDELESDAIGAAQIEWLDTFKRKLQPTRLDGDERAIAQIAKWIKMHMRGVAVTSEYRPDYGK